MGPANHLTAVLGIAAWDDLFGLSSKIDVKVIPDAQRP